MQAKRRDGYPATWFLTLSTCYFAGVNVSIVVMCHWLKLGMFRGVMLGMLHDSCSFLKMVTGFTKHNKKAIRDQNYLMFCYNKL